MSVATTLPGRPPAQADEFVVVPVARVESAPAPAGRGLTGLPETPEYDATVRAREEADDEADVKRWTAVFAQAVLEAIGGDRQVNQLVRWTHPSVYRDLERRVQLMRMARPASRIRSLRPQVRSVHVCLPSPGSAEVCVHLRHGERSRALAARLDRLGGRWVCTALELG